MAVALGEFAESSPVGLEEDRRTDQTKLSPRCTLDPSSFSTRHATTTTAATVRRLLLLPIILVLVLLLLLPPLLPTPTTTTTNDY